MLQIEKQLISLVKDNSRTTYKFDPTPNPYYRMLIHRVAAFFGLDHNVDRSSDVVIVTKTKNTRLPELKFDEVAVAPASNTETEPKRLLKREPAFEITLDKERSPERRGPLNSDHQNKSFEEREARYNEVRQRLFNQQDSLSSNDGGDGNTVSSDGRSPSMVSVSGANQAATADSSLDDLRSNSNQDIRPWSSVDSDTPQTSRRPKLGECKRSFEVDTKHTSVHTGSAATSPNRYGAHTIVTVCSDALLFAVAAATEPI